MFLDSLILTNFKNYVSQHLGFSPKLNCFTGLNGMGKTNVLDAVYYLCMCKSHFALNDALLVFQGADFLRIEGDFLSKDNKKLKIVAKVQPRKLKVFEHNGVAYEKLGEHIGKIPIVMIAPDDTVLVTEGSEERRRLIDITLSQLDQKYLNSLVIYNKIIEQRNAFLKDTTHNHNADWNLLDIYDQQLLAPAYYIHEQRKQLVAWLSPIFQSYYKKISDDREQPQCTYESKLSLTDFSQLLAQNREKDRILHRSTVGIHRDDLVFTFGDGNPAKRFASQGQLKSFLLAIKLAQYEVLRQHTNKIPILLLDDIFDKLDGERVQHLLSLLAEANFGQIFITDTQGDRMLQAIRQHYVAYHHFHVEDGSIKVQ